MLYNNSALVTHFSMVTLNKRTLVQYMQIIGVLGVINLLLSLYMAFGDIESGTCDINATLSCTSVIKSEYGKIFGVPVSYYGITWNLVLLYCIWRIYLEDKVPAFVTTIFIWCSIGIGFVFYFIAAELIIGKICPFCTLVHIINVALMYLVFQVYCQLKSPPPLFLVANSLKSFIVTVLLVHLMLIIFVNGGNTNGVGGGGIIISGINKKITNESFSQCLTRMNMVMFGSSSCGACMNQKKLFMLPGKDETESPWHYIKFIECQDSDRNFKEECEKWGIKRYPTWHKFENDYKSSENKILETHSGVMGIAELSKMSGCQYPLKENNSNSNENNDNDNEKDKIINRN
ncbi:hypothetical protein ACTFIR_002989 [Dictyostelium discoideum]